MKDVTADLVFNGKGTVVTVESFPFIDFNDSVLVKVTLSEWIGVLVNEIQRLTDDNDAKAKEIDRLNNLVPDLTANNDAKD